MSLSDLYVVEFQKRGLPHIHSLVWLKVDTDDPTPTTIDSYISAEIPDYRDDTLGYALVEEFMVHGPCGTYNPHSPCMKDGICSKHYPKEFNEETTVDGMGFPVYRRPDNGRYVVKNGHRLDNRWIVPYNMALLKRFQAHINVEWCNKTNLLKYLFKYLAKGPDMAHARLHSMYETTGTQTQGRNEISDYAKCRYGFLITNSCVLLPFYRCSFFPPLMCTCWRCSFFPPLMCASCHFVGICPHVSRVGGHLHMRYMFASQLSKD